MVTGGLEVGTSGDGGRGSWQTLAITKLPAEASAAAAESGLISIALS